MVARSGSPDRSPVSGHLRASRLRWAVPLRWAAVLAVSVVLVGGLAGCTRVPGVYVAEKRRSGGTQDGAFNATAYAEKNWSKVTQTVTDKAVDATTLLPAIAADPAAAGKQYGGQVGSPYSILVKGTGKVVAVDQAQGPGRLHLDLDPPDGTPDLSIAIGPVFLGTALRDAVGFINFGEFPNQIEYANVATALNTQVRQKVVAGADLAPGRTVTFAGAFQVLDPKDLVVTPVQLQVKP